MKRILLLSFMFLTVVAFNAMAQRTVSGTITDDAGEGLPGVNVVIQGTTTGTTTDISGNYSIAVEDGATLVFSFVGFETQEIEVGSRSVIDITLGGVTELQEVVVTAIGIEKDAKALGYSVGTVSGEDLTGKARDPNIVNSLAGKVAGVNIINASGAPGAGSRIEIRGQASLNTADANQPLFVIDGIPIFNSNPRVSGNGGAGIIQGTMDTGNAASDINPDDIESISVLKGGAAAALYGSRAKDGVIIITTKRAKKGKASITVNSSTRFDSPFRLPDYQNEYAPGDFGKYLLDSRGRPLNQGNGWGPRIEGQMLPDFRGEMVPLTAQPDNARDFYDTGVTLINSVAFQSGGEYGDVRLSLANTNQTGIIPNSQMSRYNVSIGAGAKVAKGLEARINLNYIDTETTGIPIQGGNDPNTIGAISQFFGRTVDVGALRNFIDPATGEQIPLTEGTNNPFFIVENNINSQLRERMIGSLELKYQIAEGLSFTARQGVDFFNNRIERKVVPGTLGITVNGNQRIENRESKQLNTDLILAYNTRLSSDFGLDALVGYNFNQRKTDIIDNFAQDFEVDGLFTAANAANNTLDFDNSDRRILGAYYDVGLSFRDFAFLNVTGRNDWSSTLPANNRSYFYPAVTGSFVFTEAFNIENDIFTYGKLRVGYAEVGSDEAPYQLDFRAFPVTSFFGQLGTSNVFPFGGVSGFDVTGTIPPVNLLPQNQVTLEFGLDLSFFDERLSMDLNFYRATTEDQIISLLIPASTGFRALRTNAGTLVNEGIEILVTGVPVVTNDFKWEITGTLTRNVQEVTDLPEGVDEIRLSSGFNDAVIIAKPGEPLKVVGNGYERDPSTGLPIINEATGLREEGNNIELGEINPDFIFGIANNFSYKNFDLGVMIDGKVGGIVLSNTVGALLRGGLAEETAVNRSGTFIDNGVIVVSEDADGNIVETRPNDVPVASVQEFFENTYSSRNAEAVAFDGGFVKLREVRLGYTLPKSLIANTPFTRVAVAFEGRNLLLLQSNIPHIDPETQFTGASSNFTSYEFNSIPTTRSLGFNIQLGL